MVKCTRMITRSLFITTLLLVLVFALLAGYSHAETDATGDEPETAVIYGPDHIERMANEGNFSLSSYGVTSDAWLKYESSRPDVAFLDSSGYVNLVSAGETVITVKTKDGVAEKKINLTINKSEPTYLMLRYGNEVTGKRVANVLPNADYYNLYTKYDQPFMLESVSTIPVYKTHFELLTPDIADISEDGQLTFKSCGDCRVIITTDENELFYGATFRVSIRVSKYSTTLFYEVADISGKMSEGGCQLQLVSDPGAIVHFSSYSPDIATVDNNGYVTFHKEGTVRIAAYTEETDHYNAHYAYATVSIQEDRKEQQITGNVPAEAGLGKDLDLNLSAATELNYTSSNTSVAAVSKEGVIHFLKAGKVTITASAAGNTEYQGATRKFTITVRDYAAEAKAAADAKAAAEAKAAADAKAAAEAKAAEARAAAKARAAAEAKAKAAAAKKKAAADKAKAVKRAKSLKKPVLRITRKSGKNKLTWSKVKGASGYEIFIKYPGSKKYVKALTKSARIKSVTHKGLSRGRTYRYKIRPFVKVGKAIAYGKFSNVKSAKVK